MNSGSMAVGPRHYPTYIYGVEHSIEMRPSWVLAILALGLMMSVPSVLAASWTGPTLCGTSSPATANCGSIANGGTVSIVLSQTTVTTSPAILAGWCPSTSTYNGFYVTQLRVTNTVTGAVYLLSTGTSSSHKPLSSTNPLIVAAGTIVSVPFANNPVPTTLAGQGPFSWVSGGLFNPTGLTTTSGTYQVDEAGYTLCGTTAANVQFTAKWFVDARGTFSVPEFGAGAVAVAAVGLLGLVLIRKRMVVPQARI